MIITINSVIQYDTLISDKKVFSLLTKANNMISYLFNIYILYTCIYDKSIQSYLCMCFNKINIHVRVLYKT